MIVPLKQQVCSLEPAKKLKELGIKQESLWCWWKYENNKVEKYKHSLRSSFDCRMEYREIEYQKWDKISCVSAFNVAELVEDFPDKFEGYMFGYNSESKTWWMKSPYSGELGEDVILCGETFVNAVAETKIWLIEHKHLEVS